jgi:predicted HicB family RNase H-like nuclease
LAPTQVEALDGARRLIADVVSDMSESGEQVPVPLAERHYSGKFNLRLPESVHRKLAAEAAEEGVSLNQLVIDKLAHA